MLSNHGITRSNNTRYSTQWIKYTSRYGRFLWKHYRIRPCDFDKAVDNNHKLLGVLLWCMVVLHFGNLAWPNFSGLHSTPAVLSPQGSSPPHACFQSGVYLSTSSSHHSRPGQVNRKWNDGTLFGVIRTSGTRGIDQICDIMNHEHLVMVECVMWVLQQLELSIRQNIQTI